MSECPATDSLLLCSVDDLVPGSGVAALIHDDEQIALYYLPDESPQVYALGNYDPIGGAYVMSRGVLGDVEGELVVASPLYKQHFRLETGQCIEEPEARLPTYSCQIVDGQVWLQI